MESGWSRRWVSKKCEHGRRIAGKRRTALRSPTTFNKTPDQQYEHRAHDCSNKSRTLIRPVPPDGLAEVRGNERANNSQDRGENKSLRLIVPRRDELSDYARDKANQNDPESVR